MKTITITHGDGSVQTQLVEDDFDESSLQPVSLSVIENSLLKNQIELKKKYLSDTDWYVARKSETGVEIPEEILTNRAECREFISNNRDNVED